MKRFILVVLLVLAPSCALHMELLNPLNRAGTERIERPASQPTPQPVPTAFPTPLPAATPTPTPPLCLATDGITIVPCKEVVR